MKKYFLSLVVLSFLFTASAQNNALNFDGVDDNVQLAYNNSIDFSTNMPFTIELWFKANANGTYELLSNIVNNTPAKGIVIGMVSGMPYFYTGNNFTTNWAYITCNSAFGDGFWHHLACTSNGNSNASGMSIYVDGNLQPVTINANNLTGSFNSGASYNIGSRNKYAYFYSGSIDEIRFWSKALCAADISGTMNCELTGNEPQLLAYYKFNQGIANSNNTSITTLTNNTPTSITGTLTGFALNGSTSNWLSSNPAISGVCNYTSSLLSISGPTNICSGSSVTITAIGTGPFTWSTGSNNTSIVVAPTTNTVYLVSSSGSGNCSQMASISVTVNPTPTINISSSQSSVCAGDAAAISVSGADTYSFSNGSVSSLIAVSPAVTTFYTVLGTNILSGCTSTAGITITVANCTGLKNIQSNANDVSLFPNPFKDRLIITNLTEDMIISVNTIIGKEIFRSEVHDKEIVLDLHFIDSGVYFLKILNKGGVQIDVKKAIKE